MHANRRSYGTGSLYTYTDAAGRDTWYASWHAAGRRVKRRIGPKRGEGSRHGLTRRQAEAQLRKLIADTPAAAPVGERLTVGELGRRYLRDLDRQGRKKATRVAVESILIHWLEPFFADKAIDRIEPEDVGELVALMEAGGRLRPTRRRADGSPWPAPSRRKPLGPKTIRNYIGTLSALLNFAERKGWATRNAARRVDLPGLAREDEIRFLEPAEVEAVAAAAVPGAYEAIDRALYLAAAMTGLRQGELIALRWRDVDWPAGRIRVRRNYVLGEFGTPKSRRSTRSVPMADAIAGELDRLHKSAQKWRGDADLVFADPATGGPLARAALMRRYRRALAAARLDVEHRFHDLRHTFGTRMAATGVPMRTLQEWMGHRDIETTQRYADYAPSAHEAVFIEAAFGAQPASGPAGTPTTAA